MERRKTITRPGGEEVEVVLRGGPDDPDLTDVMEKYRFKPMSRKEVAAKLRELAEEFEAEDYLEPYYFEGVMPYSNNDVGTLADGYVFGIVGGIVPVPAEAMQQLIDSLPKLPVL